MNDRHCLRSRDEISSVRIVRRKPKGLCGVHPFFAGVGGPSVQAGGINLRARCCQSIIPRTASHDLAVLLQLDLGSAFACPATVNRAAQMIDHRALDCAMIARITLILGDASREHRVELYQRDFFIRIEFAVAANDDAVFYCPADILVICMGHRHVRKRQFVCRQRGRY